MIPVETNSALVLHQTNVAKASTRIPVLVWLTVQPLIPTLGPMMTLFVVSGDTLSISLNFTCSFVSGIDWPNTNNTCTHKHTVCQISCDPGYTQNFTDCSCALTDGCEAAGQPCQSGTCTSDLSAPPYYSCQCRGNATLWLHSQPTSSSPSGRFSLDVVHAVIARIYVSLHANVKSTVINLNVKVNVKSTVSREF